MESKTVKMAVGPAFSRQPKKKKKKNVTERQTDRRTDEHNGHTVSGYSMRV